jgi:ABC-2 type transport system ATP-binding protein
MNQPVLRTDSLTKKYRGRTVVAGLSLSVERGDVFGFLGQNGAGKSTTIRMILGLVRPTSGSVQVLGHDMSRRPRKALQRVGAIIEAPAFYDNFSGRQNLRMLAAISGGVAAKRIEEVLELVGLRAPAGDVVRVYSHGMRQRLGIAQALLPRPELIILDEPTDGLDPQGLAEVRDLIRRLRDEMQLTVILSSHLLHEVEQICNRVAIIDGGRLLYQGEVQNLVRSGQCVRLKVDRNQEAFEFLTEDRQVEVSRNGDHFLYLQLPDDEIPNINALLVRQGFRVMEIASQHESLEEVFLRLTRAAATKQ